MTNRTIRNKRIQVKPLSTNALYTGRRWKTQEYRNYNQLVLFHLKNTKLTLKEGSKVFLYIKVGVSYSGADLTNTVKGFEDIISKRYGFNDNRNFRTFLEKEVVKKGEEYIEFNIFENELIDIHITYDSEDKGKFKIYPPIQS